MSKDSKETPSREQRALARLECRVFVHYRIEAEDTFKAGLARDISEGGIKFEAGWPIPPHTVLRLAIQLPLHRRLLKAKAEVVSANESGANGSYDIGAKFLDIGKKDMKIIARYMDDITSDLEGEYSEEPEREIPQVFAEREDLSVPAGGRADLAAGPEKVETKEEKEAEISALIEEIEALEITINKEREICRLGELATLSFHDLKRYPPLMLGLKFREAVTEPLLRKYGLKEEEVTEAMERCKKKFKALGTRCYIHALKAFYSLD